MTKHITFCCLFIAMGCGPAELASRTPPAVKPEPPAVLLDADWGRFRSQRHSLSIPFPDGTSWRIDDHSARWLEATHPGTHTRVLARTWIERRPVSPDHCEREARRFAPNLPTPEPGGTVDEFASAELFAPDFSSKVVVGIEAADRATEALVGYVLASGAAGPICAVFWFSTQVQGAKGHEVLADRLELGTRIVENTIYVTRLPEGPLEPIASPAPRR